MNRVILKLDERGGFEVFSDEPIELFIVADHAPSDRVYQMEATIGVEKVREVLRDDPVGHFHDSHDLGTGHGPRKPPSKRKLEVVR